MGKKGLLKMKINRKNKIMLLTGVTVLAVICGTVALKVGSIKNDKKINSVSVAKISSEQEESNRVSFISSHINKVNYKFNSMEVQTPQFEIITINFIENSLDSSNPKFDFEEGDWVAILDIKEETINNSTFYFADRDTVIQDMHLKEVDNTYIPHESIIDQLEDEDEDYNYKRDAE